MIIAFGKRKILDFSGIGFLEFFLPWYSIFIYYTLPGVGSVGQAILFLYVLFFFLIRKNIHYRIPKWLCCFTFYVLPIQMIVFRFVGGFNLSRAINLLMIVFYLVILSCFNINLNGLYKVYKFVGFIASVFIIVQIYIANQFVHQIMLLPMKIPENWYSRGIRPTGIFAEPQVYATFVLPLLILNIKRREYKWAIFFTISIIASTSSLGILCTVGIWGYYSLSSELSLLHRIIICAIGIIGVLAIVQTSLFDYAIQKIATIDYLNDVRLTRGFSIWLKLPLVNKIFGIGVNNLSYYMNSGQIILNDKMTRGMLNPAYVTSVYELMINYGLIAAMIYIMMLINLLKNTDIKILVILLFVLSLGQTILFSGVWFLYMLIIMSTLKNKNNCFLRKKRESV